MPIPVPANLTAECPYCHVVLTVLTGTYTDTRRGGCPHIEEISRVEGQIFVVFQRQLKLTQRSKTTP